MNDRWRKFIEAYMIDPNATKAAIEAGFSEKTAYSAGSRLLKNVEVMKKIDELQIERMKESKVTADMVIAELAKIAFSDPRQLFNDKNDLMPISDLSDEAAGALASFESVAEFDGMGDDREMIGYLKKVKLWDKAKALDMLAKHFGLYAIDDVPDKAITINIKMPDRSE